MAYKVMAYKVMAYKVMAYIVMAYIVMAYIVMAHVRAALSYIPYLANSACSSPLYGLYLGIADGMSSARVWACRYSK